MEMLYTSRGMDKYLEVRLDRIDEIQKRGNEYKLHMLCENTWKHMIKPTVYEENANLILRYNSNSHYILKNMLSSVKPDGNILKIICKQIHHTISCLKEYLLNENDLVIDSEYMLYNQVKKEIKLIYIPGYDKNLRIQLKHFLENLMTIFDYRDKDGIVLLYQMYDKITDEAQDVDEILQEISREGYLHDYQGKSEPYVIKQESYHENKKCAENKKYAETKSITENKNSVENERYPYEEYSDENDKSTWRMSWKIVAAVGICDILLFAKYMSEKTEGKYLLAAIALFAILGGLVAYMILFKEEKGSSCKTIKNLCPITNIALDTITLDEEDTKILIGRDRKDVDYRLETTQISRVHACVERLGENIYIMDMNSTNGTFVNDIRIRPMQLCLLKHGDIIRIADEEFCCR